MYIVDLVIVLLITLTLLKFNKICLRKRFRDSILVKKEMLIHLFDDYMKCNDCSNISCCPVCCKQKLQCDLNVQKLYRR